jgi:undecaprenyl diphosphate synthase
MDGNGRWAKSRGLPRIAGHREGVKSVRDVVKGCDDLDIQILTLYTFSTENWKRPMDEVSALMRLLLITLQKEINELNKNNVRLIAVGDLEKLPAGPKEGLKAGIEATKSNTGLILNLALNYGAREEIIYAIRNIAQSIENKKLTTDQINDELFSKMLYTADLPDPDLLIRTSGEFRLSNFLLWQLAYTEIYITDILWPDFRKRNLFEAILDYQKRERRFGKVSEQIDSSE